MPSQTSRGVPKTGDTLRCKECGMELKVSKGCKCENGAPRLECCGKPLSKS